MGATETMECVQKEGKEDYGRVHGAVTFKRQAKKRCQKKPH